MKDDAIASGRTETLAILGVLSATVQGGTCSLGNHLGRAKPVDLCGATDTVGLRGGRGDR
jgi:hypothetical protein